MLSLTSRSDIESEHGAVASSGVVGSARILPGILYLHTAQLKDGLSEHLAIFYHLRVIDGDERGGVIVQQLVSKLPDDVWRFIFPISHTDIGHRRTSINRYAGIWSYHYLWVLCRNNMSNTV